MTNSTNVIVRELPPSGQYPIIDQISDKVILFTPGAQDVGEHITRRLKFHGVNYERANVTSDGKDCPSVVFVDVDDDTFLRGLAPMVMEQVLKSEHGYRNYKLENFDRPVKQPRAANVSGTGSTTTQRKTTRTGPTKTELFREIFKREGGLTVPRKHIIEIACAEIGISQQHAGTYYQQCRVAATNGVIK